jgi:hypothetical protein
MLSRLSYIVKQLLDSGSRIIAKDCQGETG